MWSGISGLSRTVSSSAFALQALQPCDLLSLLVNDAIEFRYIAQQLHHKLLPLAMRQARHLGRGALLG
jgi:hypothetical protein